MQFKCLSFCNRMFSHNTLIIGETARGGRQLSAQIIMVASGKGGTGKSTVSVLLGSRLAAADKKVLLIELDSGLRSVDIISGVNGKTVYDISDVLSGRCDWHKAIAESPIYEGLSVISAPYERGDVKPQELKRLIQKLANHYDFILVDTAAGLGEPFAAAMLVSQMALLVLTPDPVALRDGHIAADVLFEGGFTNVRLVVNRVSPNTFEKGVVEDLDECIDTVAVQLIGVIPDSVAILKCSAAGQPLPANTVAYRAFDNLARRILGEDVLLAVR